MIDDWTGFALPKTGKKKKKRDTIPKKIAELVWAKWSRCANKRCMSTQTYTRGELHHWIKRSHSGGHTVNNLVRLCPLCHWKCHHGDDGKTGMQCQLEMLELMRPPEGRNQDGSIWEYEEAYQYTKLRAALREAM